MLSVKTALRVAKKALLLVNEDQLPVRQNMLATRTEPPRPPELVVSLLGTSAGTPKVFSPLALRENATSAAHVDGDGEAGEEAVAD
jgi:hypothetical protein